LVLQNQPRRRVGRSEPHATIAAGFDNGKYGAIITGHGAAFSELNLLDAP
jgi:hypothetical protein